MLSDADKALYARQILLSELGLPGQERLCTTELELPAAADARARAVARDYLERAGAGSRATGAGATLLVPLPSADDVRRVGGDPALEDCAAWLLGSFAAVEAIKVAAQVGTSAELDPGFVLSPEVR